LEDVKMMSDIPNTFWDPLIKDGKIVWIQIEVRVKGWQKRERVMG
jgi:hypothetical protein